VAATIVLFINTNLLSSPFALQAFYTTMNKKKILLVSSTTAAKKKDDGSVGVVAFFVAL
jgi:hypothetical protein